jgi:hypothetical protein
MGRPRLSGGDRWGWEKDHRRFEKGCEVHEKQTRSVHEEASETPEEKHERPRQSDKDQER